MVKVLKDSKHFSTLSGSIQGSAFEHMVNYLIMFKKSNNVCICTVLKVNESFKRENPIRKTKSFVKTK